MGSSRDPNSSFWRSWSHSSVPHWTESGTISDHMQTSAPNPECPDLFKQLQPCVMSTSTPCLAGSQALRVPTPCAFKSGMI